MRGQINSYNVEEGEVPNTQWNEEEPLFIGLIGHSLPTSHVTLNLTMLRTVRDILPLLISYKECVPQASAVHNTGVPPSSELSHAFFHSQK